MRILFGIIGFCIGAWTAGLPRGDQVGWSTNPGGFIVEEHSYSTGQLLYVVAVTMAFIAIGHRVQKRRRNAFNESSSVDGDREEHPVELATVDVAHPKSEPGDLTAETRDLSFEDSTASEAPNASAGAPIRPEALAKRSEAHRRMILAGLSGLFLLVVATPSAFGLGWAVHSLAAGAMAGAVVGALGLLLLGSTRFFHLRSSRPEGALERAEREAYLLELEAYREGSGELGDGSR